MENWHLVNTINKMIRTYTDTLEKISHVMGSVTPKEMQIDLYDKVEDGRRYTLKNIYNRLPHYIFEANIRWMNFNDQIKEMLLGRDCKFAFMSRKIIHDANQPPVYNPDDDDLPF